MISAGSTPLVGAGQGSRSARGRLLPTLADSGVALLWLAPFGEEYSALRAGLSAMQRDLFGADRPLFPRRGAAQLGQPLPAGGRDARPLPRGRADRGGSDGLRLSRHPYRVAPRICAEGVVSRLREQCDPDRTF